MTAKRQSRKQVARGNPAPRPACDQKSDQEANNEQERSGPEQATRGIESLAHKRKAGSDEPVHEQDTQTRPTTR